MDIGFDLENREHHRSQGCLEWHGLRARLFAARAARHALEAAGRADYAIAVGSFDRGSARLLVNYGNDLAAVNPTALSNCKPRGDIDAAVADESRTGDRG